MGIFKLIKFISNLDIENKKQIIENNINFISNGNNAKSEISTQYNYTLIWKRKVIENN